MSCPVQRIIDICYGYKHALHHFWMLSSTESLKNLNAVILECRDFGRLQVSVTVFKNPLFSCFFKKTDRLKQPLLETIHPFVGRADVF